MQDKFSLNNRNFSYWEHDNLIEKRDYIIVGGGLVGLSTAISIKEKYPGASILILERANIPYGASTRNAGFACFGSISEIIQDIDTLGTSEVEALIKRRWDGLRLLRDRVGDTILDYLALGGYEVFTADQKSDYNDCLTQLPEINLLIERSIGLPNCFQKVDHSFGMIHYESLIYNQYEGQIHPGKMMQHLKKTALEKGVEIANGIEVTSYEPTSAGISVSTTRIDLNFESSKLLLTTNAFTKSLLGDLDLMPGRNQVLMTKPIKDLKLKGCYHYDKGYVYFRNYKDRLLIGGGRNIALDEETTDSFGLTDSIKNYLRGIVSNIILPNTPYEEDLWWSGIIATGATKKPIVQELSTNVYLGVRLGGMGVAMGSLIGQDLADLV